MESTQDQAQVLPVNQIVLGDAVEVLRTFPDASIDCCVTSPPYWGLRDYNIGGQLGQEKSPGEYVEHLGLVFDEVHRVTKDSGTLFLNVGDTYVKGELMQIPSQVALRLAQSGWILKNEIIWQKPNAVPVSVRNRFTVDFEKVYFFTKTRDYYFEQQFEPLLHSSIQRYSQALRQIENGQSNSGKVYKQDMVSVKTQKSANRIWDDRESLLRTMQRGRNRRAVWQIPTAPHRGSHAAPYPPALVKIPVIAGCPEGGVVLDPFMGTGTTAQVALENARDFVGIELSPEYIEEAREKTMSLFA